MAQKGPFIARLKAVVIGVDRTVAVGVECVVGFEVGICIRAALIVGLIPEILAEDVIIKAGVEGGQAGEVVRAANLVTEIHSKCGLFFSG